MTPVTDRLRSLGAPAVERVRNLLVAAGPWARIRWTAVAVWLAVSVGAVAFAFSDPEANALDARVSVVATGLGTVVVVEHGGEAPWVDLTVTLTPGGWRVHRAVVRPGEQLTLSMDRFVGADVDAARTHPPDDWRPESVVLTTGDETVAVRVRRER